MMYRTVLALLALFVAAADSLDGFKVKSCTVKWPEDGGNSMDDADSTECEIVVKGRTVNSILEGMERMAELDEPSAVRTVFAGAACITPDGSDYPPGGTQLMTCGANAYCCAGGDQAVGQNCKDAKTAEETRTALSVPLNSIRACCHTGGTDPAEPAHVTVATDSNDQAMYHPACPV